MSIAAKAPPVLVETIMTKDVITIQPHMTVRDAIHLLISNRVRGCPVVDNFSKVLTVVTEGDLLKLAASQGLNSQIGMNMAKLVKVEDLLTAKPSDTFTSVYRAFLSRPVQRVIVIDGNGKLMGLVSRSNVLKVLIETPAVAQSEQKAEEKP